MADQQQTCEFCDISLDVKYKCEDCDLLLCEICNDKVHTKLPSFISEHNVTRIKTETNEQGLNIDLKRVHCSRHNEQTCFAVCQNCENSICTACLVKPNEHERLNIIYQEKCEKLREYKNIIEQALPFFTDNASNLEKLKEEGLEEYNNIKKQILDKEEEMKDKIAEHAMALVKELDEWWFPHRDQILKGEKKIKEAERDLRERRNIIEEALQSNRIESIMEAADIVVKDLPEMYEECIPPLNPIKFTTENSAKTFELGSIMKIPTLEIFDSFPCNCTNKLVILENNEIVGCNRSKKELKTFVLLSYPDNDCFYIHSKDEIYINDMTVSKSKKKVLFTKGNNSSIYELCQGKLDEFLFTDIAPLIPRGIHVSNNGNIIIGYRDHIEPSFPPAEDSKREILILNEEKIKIQTIECNENEKRLFHMPNVITQNKNNENNDIYVVDSTARNWEGRVIALEQCGKLKWIYNGQAEINFEKTFKPRDITTTSKGGIFVSDSNTCTVHMLSLNGVFITSFGSSEEILVCPTGLTTDEEDQILIGCVNDIHIMTICCTT